jgi:hypothetical protein
MDRTRQRFQMALGLTFLGLLFAVPALFGCDLHKSNDSFVACAPWSETVLWTRVMLGAPILLVAGFAWRLAVKSIDGAPSQRESSSTHSNMINMMGDLTTFVVVTVAAGTLVHFVTIYPMPWWPDTLMMGLPFGAVAALSAWQHRHGNQLIWNALKDAAQRLKPAPRS